MPHDRSQVSSRRGSTNSRLVATLILFLVATASIATAQPGLPPIATGPTSTEAGVVNEATVVLQELVAGARTQIPANLLATAEGVAIVPHYVRGAFVLGIAGGRGVLVVRDANRNWLAPEFITIGGGSIGWQAGVQATDLVLVFRSPKSLANMRQGKLTLGVNASAAAGPIGRDAGAATDASAQAEIFTYSKTRGLFAGVSLTGANVQIDVPATQVYYQTNTGGPGVVPPSAISLINELTRFSTFVPPVELAAGSAVSTTASPGSLPTNPSSLPDPLTPQPGPTSSLPLNPVVTVAMVPLPADNVMRLENAVSALVTNVDPQWQAYLSLPIGWRGAKEVPADQIYSTLTRYERVATNPQFAALRSLPAFNDALKELRELAARAPTSEHLRLPPPPTIDAGDVSRGRY
jgi:SH3 domain-containing YSC84-like protein 1